MQQETGTAGGVDSPPVGAPSAPGGQFLYCAAPSSVTSVHGSAAAAAFASSTGHIASGSSPSISDLFQRGLEKGKALRTDAPTPLRLPSVGSSREETMESPASACPSKHPPDAINTFDLEAGIKPMLPDSSTAFKLDEAGDKPMLPDPCTMFKLHEAGDKPMLPDPCSMFKLDEAGVKPKMPDACAQIKLEASIEEPYKLPEPDACAKINLEAGIEEPKLPKDACSKINLEAGIQEPYKLPDACAKIKLEAGVEPKREPCEEDAPPLPPPALDAAADDWEITPLSGSNPFFSTVLSRSHVQKFQLTIPTRFQRHLPEARVPVVLHYGGRSWMTSYRGDLKCKKLDNAGWRDFAVGNRLRVGDACVFELIMGDEARESADEAVGTFRVQVLRGDLPEEITSRGATSDDPVLIVD